MEVKFLTEGGLKAPLLNVKKDGIVAHRKGHEPPATLSTHRIQDLQKQWQNLYWLANPPHNSAPVRVT